MWGCVDRCGMQMVTDLVEEGLGEDLLGFLRVDFGKTHTPLDSNQLKHNTHISLPRRP